MWVGPKKVFELDPNPKNSPKKAQKVPQIWCNMRMGTFGILHKILVKSAKSCIFACYKSNESWNFAYLCVPFCKAGDLEFQVQKWKVQNVHT